MALFGGEGIDNSVGRDMTVKGVALWPSEGNGRTLIMQPNRLANTSPSPLGGVP